MTCKSSEFRAPDRQVKHVYLTKDEVNTLFIMPLTGHLEKTRDIFIIGYHTGLRVSDTEKTGESVYIPVHWQVRAILKKYSGLPPLITDPKLNTRLKELCKLA
jgi:integrase